MFSDSASTKATLKSGSDTEALSWIHARFLSKLQLKNLKHSISLLLDIWQLNLQELQASYLKTKPKLFSTWGKKAGPKMISKVAAGLMTQINMVKIWVTLTLFLWNCTKSIKLRISSSIANQGRSLLQPAIWMAVTHIPHNLPTAQKTVSVLDKVKKKLIKLRWEYAWSSWGLGIKLSFRR